MDPRSGSSKGGKGWEPKKFRVFFFSVSRHKIRSFLPSLGVVEFWCLKRRGIQCARLDFLWLSCEAAADSECSRPPVGVASTAPLRQSEGQLCVARVASPTKS